MRYRDEDAKLIFVEFLDAGAPIKIVEISCHRSPSQIAAIAEDPSILIR